MAEEGTAHAGKKSAGNIIIIACLFVVCYSSCKSNGEQQPVQTRKADDYIKKIRGEDDSVSATAVTKGEVLIGYADCYTCHKEDRRSVGPAFKDIASRYAIRQEYITYLARKVITGGSGSWGYPVMTPHPSVSVEEAKLMVTYILSRKYSQ